MLDAIKNAASDAAEAVTNVVGDAAASAMETVCENRLKEITGGDIKVVIDLDDEKEWMLKTGVNSLCNDGSWTFLRNARKKAKWDERKIDKIVMKYNANPDEDLAGWCECWPEWEEGSTTLTIVWLPRCTRVQSNNAWPEPGHKRWWHIGDEISFALQLYQLAGKCFYKSDWLDDFEDVDEDAVIPNMTKKTRRWFQFRHWIIYWYPHPRWGWNWEWTTKPPALPDGTDFSLDSIFGLPGLPDFEMPKISLPSLPDIEMPDVSMPDVSLPDAPSLSAPSLSAPSLGSLPSMPDRKMRPEGRWACHGYIQLKDMKVKADGKSLILSNCTMTHFWKRGEGRGIDTEEKDRQRMVLACTDAEQAESWKESLMGSGVEEGDTGGCCTVA